MSEVKMPRIALGAWAWGNDGTFGDHYTADSLREVYETAMANGLNLWDTATVYGTHAQAPRAIRGIFTSLIIYSSLSLFLYIFFKRKVLGELIRNTKREDVILSTKFTPQIEDGTPQAMEHMLNGSLNTMHTDYMDIY